jgi:DNA-binding transcriptional ArsR family regulator
VTLSAPIEVFAALGDPTRHRLLDELAGREPASAAALAEPLTITRQAVEKHLRVLEHAGLVRADREGRRVRYAVRPETLSASATWLDQVARGWERRLAAVKAAAERG